MGSPLCQTDSAVTGEATVTDDLYKVGGQSWFQLAGDRRKWHEMVCVLHINRFSIKN